MLIKVNIQRKLENYLIIGLIIKRKEERTMNQWVNYLMLNETDADSKLSNIKEPTQQEIAKILSQNSDLFQATWLGNFFKVIGWLIT